MLFRGELVPAVGQRAPGIRNSWRRGRSSLRQRSDVAPVPWRRRAELRCTCDGLCIVRRFQQGPLHNSRHQQTDGLQRRRWHRQRQQPMEEPISRCYRCHLRRAVVGGTAFVLVTASRVVMMTSVVVGSVVTLTLVVCASPS
jgi:hypothetical protein